jgi:Fic family protein
MDRGLQGYLIPTTTGDETYRSYVPNPLPPEPRLVLDEDLQDLMERANRALGRLDGIAVVLPDPSLFLYFYVRKEAVLSAQIEGTQSSLSDLLLSETSDVAGALLDDVNDVSNYVAAQSYGMKALSDGQPLTLRLIRQIHGVLLSRGRRSDRAPGEFRASQNRIGGSRPGNAVYVPPPPLEVSRLMGDLANFVNDIPARMPALIKAALAHVQFESIHPFLDGNGRLGRLLVTVILRNDRAIVHPLLYLSLFFKTHRAEYYQLLQDVRISGDWERWLRFFLTGVEITADQAIDTTRRIRTCFEGDRARIETRGRPARSALLLHQHMQKHPIISIAKASDSLKLSKPTIGSSVKQLANLGIVHPLKSHRRGMLYVYSEYLRILNEGTESPA